MRKTWLRFQRETGRNTSTLIDIFKNSKMNSGELFRASSFTEVVSRIEKMIGPRTTSRVNLPLIVKEQMRQKMKAIAMPRHQQHPMILAARCGCKSPVWRTGFARCEEHCYLGQRAIALSLENSSIPAALHSLRNLVPSLFMSKPGLQKTVSFSKNRLRVHRTCQIPQFGLPP
jgi:hypothetical protein